MTPLEIAVIVIVLVIVQVVATAFVTKRLQETNKESFKEERQRINENVEAKIQMGDKDLESKKDLILQALNNVKNEVSANQKDIVSLKTVVEQHKTTTEALRMTTDNLRKILSNNQLRGSFGQEVAEDLLKIAGFVKGQNYTTQEQQSSGNKPDFTVLMPDGSKINIDVKFPFQALQRWQETEDAEQQKQYLAEFKQDIKAKIKEVTTRDYISVEDNTVDFVVMFIPNEMIFSFVYEKFTDVWQEAMKSKVVMCGPFGFTATLRMVQKSYDNFRYQKGLHGIIAQIKNFEKEYKKFSESWDNLGKKITATSSEFEEMSGVRDRQLTRTMDKITSGELLLESPDRKVK